MHNIIQEEMFTGLESIILSLSITLVIFAVVQLVYRKKTFLNYLLVILYFSLAYVLFYLWMYNSALLPPFLFCTECAVAFLVGPLLFLYYGMIGGVIKKDVRYMIPVLLSFICLFAAIVTLNLINPVTMPAVPPLHPFFQLSPLWNSVNTAVDFWFFICSCSLNALLLKNGIPFKKRSTYNYFLSLIAFAYFWATFLMGLSHFIKSDILVILSIVMYISFAFASIFFIYRYPKETQVVLAVSKGSGITPQLKDTLPEGIYDKFNELMVSERLYSEPDVSVKQVAELLGITANQLSLLVNSHYKMNFRTFINKLRLEDARKALLDNESMNILDIAYYVGFNTKASFNSNFKAHYGITPSEYRKEKCC